MEKLCIENSNFLIVPSVLTANTLLKMGVRSEKLVVIQNSASEDFFNQENVGEQKEANKTQFGYFGSCHPWEGTEVLLRAWSQVEADFPETELMLIHSRNPLHLRRIKRLISQFSLENRTKLTLIQNSQQIAQLMKSFLFTCLPLLETPRNVLQGCCPVKIIQSLACGVPVISSDLSVVREIIKTGENGILSEPGDARSLAMAITKMIFDEDLRKKLSLNAFQTARDHFTPEKMGEAFMEIFRKKGLKP
ncbi:MAG: glycosyltransferase [Candidatus Riflebacteria bacterium]|nr:glycosyltransferase [Candidatus Riflebacteria bacterium]